MAIPFTSTFLPSPATPVESVWADSLSSLSERIGAALTQWSQRRTDRPETAIDEFSDFIAEAYEPGTVDQALVNSAWRIAGPDARDVRVVRGERAPNPSIGDTAKTAHFVEFPLRFGGQVAGALQIVFDEPYQFSTERHRQLTTLAVLAAAVPHQSPSLTPVVKKHPTHDLTTGLPNSMFLSPFLRYAFALSDRRREPLSLLYIGVDRLTAIRDLHGAEIADASLDRVGQATIGTLRTSDLLARLDDGRLVAVLPGASADSARAVAESIRAAVATLNPLSTTLPTLAVSIGVASYPESAGDPIALRSAAAAALTVARSKGSDQVMIAAPARSPKSMTLLRLAE